MLWFWIALVGYFLLAVVFVLDKMILTKSVSTPAVYAFYSTIFMFAALLAFPFGAQLLQGIDWLWALISGLSFGFALWTMYEAVSLGEASHVDPFIGGVVTIATFGFSSWLLGESLTQMQVFGMAILIIAAFLLSFEKTAKHTGFHKGFLWGILSGVLFGLSHVSAKYVYDAYDFFTGFVWTRGFVGLVAIFALLAPSVRASFKKRKKKKRTKKQERQTLSTVAIISLDKVIGVVAVILVQYASSLGKTTPVFAMTGVQYALMFVMIYLLSRFTPKIFKECFTKRELWVQTFAIVLVVIGSALFVL
ncbi:MAG: DMT family transporter [Candidatus Magasanikbacteria bacterium]|jgi:drug/metabolite transporter (DMT)-like permease|nr:DMT family transporter [Candidatus Magasanikbacteria bacterium]